MSKKHQKFGPLTSTLFPTCVLSAAIQGSYDIASTAGVKMGVGVRGRLDRAWVYGCWCMGGGWVGAWVVVFGYFYVAWGAAGV